ncbi:hypothetical protein FOMPIDRAFT_61838, partial [Fomitopsis schrenkii]
LLFYDYALTFSREVRCIWRRKFTGATMLFLLNRYLFMVYLVSRFYLEMSPINTMSLDVLLILYLWSALFTRSTQMRGLFTALRMYAIWYKNRKIFGVVLFLGVVPIGVNMVCCQAFI